MTQGNNAKFLPAGAPSEHAAELAAPFGTANLASIPVVAARPGSALTTADLAALTALQGKLRSVSGVVKVVDAGRSPDGQAEQLVVFTRQGGGSQAKETDLVGALRVMIAHAGLPAGLSAHLAGRSPRRRTRALMVPAGGRSAGLAVHGPAGLAAADDVAVPAQDRIRGDQ